MKHIFKKHGKKIGLALILIAPLPFMQNCSPPSLPSVASTGSSSLSSLSGATINASSVGIMATYNPPSPTVGNQVVITGVNGTAPYTYRLETTATGSISGNILTVTAAGVSKVLVLDAKGAMYELSITVGGGSGTTTTSTATPTPSPTPVPVASTTSSTTMPNGIVIPRSCTVNTAQQVIGNHDWDIVYGTTYQYCMILGRGYTNDEGNYWFHGIKQGYADASQMAPTLFKSAEFNLRFGTTTMTNQQYALFIVRLLAYREPSVAETNSILAQAGTQTGSAAQSAMLTWYTGSSYFKNANPYLTNLTNAYQDD